MNKVTIKGECPDCGGDVILNTNAKQDINKGDWAGEVGDRGICIKCKLKVVVEEYGEDEDNYVRLAMM